MANIADPVKNRQFSVEIDGYQGILAQKMTKPTLEIDVAEHIGDGAQIIKTASGIKTGDLILTNVVDGADASSTRWSYSELKKAVDPETGLIGSPTDYKRNIVIRQLRGDGTYAASFMCEGCFVKAIDDGEQDKASTDNLERSVTISVDKFYQF